MRPARPAPREDGGAQSSAFSRQEPVYFGRLTSCLCAARGTVPVPAQVSFYARAQMEPEQTRLLSALSVVPAQRVSTGVVPDEGGEQAGEGTPQ